MRGRQLRPPGPAARAAQRAAEEQSRPAGTVAEALNALPAPVANPRRINAGMYGTPPGVGDFGHIDDLQPFPPPLDGVRLDRDHALIMHAVRVAADLALDDDAIEDVISQAGTLLEWMRKELA